VRRGMWLVSLWLTDKVLCPSPLGRTGREARSAAQGCEATQGAVGGATWACRAARTANRIGPVRGTRANAGALPNFIERS
jgi:hypothetical protein